MCLSIGGCVCVYVYTQCVCLLFPIFPLFPLIFRYVGFLEAWLGEHNVIAANFTKQQIDDELMLWKLLGKKYLIALRRAQAGKKKKWVEKVWLISRMEIFIEARSCYYDFLFVKVCESSIQFNVPHIESISRSLIAWFEKVNHHIIWISCYLEIP